MTGALAVTVYLGLKYLLDLDSQTNDVPIGNLTGIRLLTI